jgi:Bacterial PH domain
MSAPMAGPEVYRFAAPVILWWAWLAFATANLVDVAVQGSARFAVIVAVVLVTVTGVIYACALRPRVVADDAGLRVLNPVRDYQVPWASVLTVDVGDWVRVHCAPVPGSASGKTIDSWALFVPARTRLKARRRTRDPGALVQVPPAAR